MNLLAITPLLLCFLAADEPKPLDPFEAAQVAAMLHFAEEGNVDYLQAIVEKYPQLINRAEQFRQPRKPVSTDDFTALHYAAAEGREGAVAYLISKGADLNSKAGLDWTPLHLAAKEGHLGIVKLLVKGGAKANARTAFVKGYIGVAPSSPPDAKPMKFDDIPSYTPLELARDRKQGEVVKFLEALDK